MSWLSKFLHPDQPYKAAQNDLSKYFQMAQMFTPEAHQVLEPYTQMSQQQYPELMNLTHMLQNPQLLENQWASGYQESPYAKQLESEARERGLEEASSMGLNASAPAISNIQHNAANIMQSDRQNYMNDLMQKFLNAIPINQNIFNAGLPAATTQSQNISNAANNVMRMGENSANLTYGKESAGPSMLGKFLGMGASGLGNYINYKTGSMR